MPDHREVRGGFGNTIDMGGTIMSDQKPSSKMEEGIIKEPTVSGQPAFDDNATAIGLLREIAGLQRLLLGKAENKSDGGKTRIAAILEKAMVPLLVVLLATAGTLTVGWLQSENARRETVIKLLPNAGDDEQKKLSSLMAIYAMGYEDKAIELAKSYSLSGVGGLAALVQIGCQSPGNENTRDAMQFVLQTLEEKPAYCQEITIREMFCQIKSPELTAKAVKLSGKEGALRGLLSIVQCPDLVTKDEPYFPRPGLIPGDGAQKASAEIEAERKRAAQEVAIDTLLRMGTDLEKAHKLVARIQDKNLVLSTARRFGPGNDYFIWQWNKNEANREAFYHANVKDVRFILLDKSSHDLQVFHHLPSVYDAREDIHGHSPAAVRAQLLTADPWTWNRRSGARAQEFRSQTERCFAVTEPPVFAGCRQLGP